MTWARSSNSGKPLKPRDTKRNEKSMRGHGERPYGYGKNSLGSELLDNKEWAILSQASKDTTRIIYEEGATT